MEGTSTKGVLSHLSFLEAQAKSRVAGVQPQSRETQLRTQVEKLRKQRDRLRAEIEVHQNLQALRMSLGKNKDFEAEDDTDNLKLLQLMAKHTRIKDVLLAHHFLGGYDVVKTNHGKSLCFSLPTAFQGTMLETYFIEIDVKENMRISRHNIPPFINLDSLVKEANMQENMRGFLDTLSLHLNAFAARKQQLKLIKELHKSVVVLESNALCSQLVLMLTISEEKRTLLCSLDYSNHASCLPSSVSIQCEEKDLSRSPQWQKNKALLHKTPVHEALTIMKERLQII